jgi:hypothetical protein
MPHNQLLILQTKSTAKIPKSSATVLNNTRGYSQKMSPLATVKDGY